MDIKQARALLQRYQTGNITQSEKELVERWYRQLVETGEWEWGEGEKEQLQQTIEYSLLKKISGTPGVHTIRSNRRIWWAAASITILLGISIYFLRFNTPLEPKQIVNAKMLPDDVQAPQSSKAMITLANGQKVYIDSIGNGASVLQGNAKLVKLSNGEIAYRSSGIPGNEIQYNTLVNPRGSKVINMVLTDGTKVWLNAGSSLVYPVVFANNKREVTVTGEAYFEVAHDRSKQFVVHKGSMDVIVMGTHFNVNAFEDDDNNIKVTLLEGSVKVKNGNSNGLLKPGEQALVHNEVKIVGEVNIEKVMAWKNGYFQFDKAGLQSVLKQVARWYDIEVIYEGINRHREFVGEMERDLSLSEMLRILEMNKVSFTIEGKKLLVKPD
jgi:ferric-dicitrate binding protein FerR (iron transport regulator)